jgi:chromosome segregation ATPase
MCGLHIDNRGYKDQVEMMEKAIKSLKDQLKENKSTIDTKNQEICDLRFDSRGYEDHNKLLENECESQIQVIRERDQTIESLVDQLREKEMMIIHDTKEIKKLRGELKKDSSPDEEEEDSEEEPRRRYVAPTVDDPLVPVMENGEKKWYRRSECCGSYSWGGEELWVRNWM